MTEPSAPASAQYGNCLGCGTCVPIGISHCEGCMEKQGQTPQFLVNVNASQKRPPYERRDTAFSEE